MPNVSGPTFSLVSDLRKSQNAQRALVALTSGKSISIDGVTGSVAAAVLCSILPAQSNVKTAVSTEKTGVKSAGLLAKKKKTAEPANDSLNEEPGTWVVVQPDESQADCFSTDLESLAKLSQTSLNILRFPTFDLFTHRNSLIDENYGERLRILKRLDSGKADSKRPDVIITTLPALLQKTPKKQFLAKQTLTLRKNDDLGIKDLIDFLLGSGETGFHRTPAVQMPGEFSVRGGIVDVYPLDFDDPVRIEFFGDEIDSLRTFAVGNQKSLNSLDSIDLTVSSPVLPGNQSAADNSDGNSNSPASCNHSNRQNNSNERSLVSTKQKADELMDYFTDHLPANSRIVYINPIDCEETGRKYLNNQDALLRHQREMEKVGGFSGKNDLLAPAIEMDDLPAYLGTVSYTAGRLYDFPMVAMAPFSTLPLDEHWHIESESVEMFTGDFNRILQQFDELSHEQSIHLLCSTPTEIQRLTDLLQETQTSREGRLHFHIGLISSGFRLLQTSPEDGLRPTVLSSDEMFKRGTVKRSSSRHHLGKVIDSFSELKEGDFVVHLGHGIARYLGVVLLDRPDGQSEENLKLEFADDTTLYVPVSRIGLVQKYIGTGSGDPPLARVGGRRWKAQTEKVAQEIADMAGEMLHLQALRKTQPGVSFPVETALQKEFDACFPYTETPDQLETMKAIDSDMSQSRPMDRLLCGDVGFGKTEMAIRAAFRAVEAGYQVAVLVPTTVLCEQHLQTFKARMAEFPVRIAALSRFTLPAEQDRIIEQTKRGSVDIVIGTHRLVSKDVKFNNLGLIIIDEEQKFGVEVKEKLKQFRASVDILTMTATPIPRTLHFAMLGIRDISNLQTPPEDRMPVETHVVRFSDELVRSAIERELARKGQVFFVHNKVYDIDIVAEKIKQLVPEARVAVGHAQMAEGELEVVMRDFVTKKYDILVCTTIVESGLDIPNANTIFIDQADKFGLSNLHQLRGRVGRYKNRAYCYLLIENSKVINPTAVKRLKAIEEFSQLGAGFTLAMRDLEIRGAGNILGKEQSGHIAMIGYELYCQLLEDAVRKQTKQPPRETNNVNVLLPVTAYIPDFYISDMRQKMDLYRRISRVVKMRDVDLINEELRDRFDDPPAEVVHLMELAALRVMAHEKFINKIYSDGTYYIFEFASRRIMEQIQTKTKRPIRIADDNTAWMKVEPRDSDPVYLMAMMKALLKN